MQELQQRFAEVEEAVRLKEERGEEGEKEHLKVVNFIMTFLSQAWYSGGRAGEGE